MFEEKEYKGFWWLPDAEDRKIPGYLEYNPKMG